MLKLYRNKKTREVFLLNEKEQIYCHTLPLVSLFDGKTSFGDIADYEKINVASLVNVDSCKRYFLQEEEVNFKDFKKKTWKLGDSILVLLKNGSEISFKVEHINKETGKTYFVSDKSVGECDMEESDMNYFLDELESEFPDELLDIMKPIEHINELRTCTRKLSLLSLANVEENAIKNCKLIGEDDVLFDGMKTEINRTRGNKKGETSEYWLDTPYCGSRTAFMCIHDGKSGYFEDESIVRDVIVCFAI